jgi:outer membrane protein OmpA-like peptidoglycan-associated protein
MKTALRKTLLLPLLFFCFISLNAQELSKTGFIRAVREADLYYYYDQNYEKAASLFESLLKIYPDNSNLISKLGICYLNLDGKSPDALKLLSKASLNIVSSDKEYTEYGDKAPLDTYLYLAIAYHQNDSLQKALTLYYDAKKRLKDTKAFREDYIDMQIGDCRYAIEMKKKPYTIITDLFTSWLSDYPGACNPVLAKNDSVFVFTQKENGKTRVLCSYKSGTWQIPMDITEELGGFDRFYTNSITGDGKLLIIYMDDGGDGNLYYSQRKDNVWSRIKSVGKPINTIYWQSDGFITPDGQTMYYSSNQPGGEGELDIWYSEKNAEGKWGEPVNCGNVINTPFNEDTPFFDQETGALLFSSVGHISMGGYDVFRSVKKNGTWTTPIGMPYSFNNTKNNSFFILNNNKPGFITSLYDEKTKSRNIYEIVAENPADKITLAKGTVTLKDGMAVDPKLIHIWLVDSGKGNTPENIPLSDSTSFEFKLKPGDYQLFVNHQGYKTDTINLNIPLFYSANYVSVNANLIPEKVSGGEFLSIDNILFEFNSSELNDVAKSRLDLLKSVLINYPELKVEVSGYTDNKGTREYNTILADKRAQNVINYLATSPASSLKFVKKAYGKSDFVAVNYNADGSDNPEGRRYNRRVTFGIIDPKTGVVIRQETYTPEHLRQPHSLRYSIVLLKTAKKLVPGYFSSLIKDDLLFIRTINMDTVSMYTLGVFYNKNDALKYLEYARASGFNTAYLLDQYELNNESKLNLTPEEKKARISKIDQRIYSIQLKATRNPLDISKIFSGIEGVKEIKSGDGFYKYYCGEYLSQSKAREALLTIKKSGFEDAFIVKLFELDNDSKNLNAGEDKGISGKIDQGLYTIQLKATKNPLDIGKIFTGMTGVKEKKSDDGLYKYYYGEYSEFSKANEALQAIKKLGYEDAFIKSLH